MALPQLLSFGRVANCQSAIYSRRSQKCILHWIYVSCIGAWILAQRTCDGRAPCSHRVSAAYAQAEVAARSTDDAAPLFLLLCSTSIMLRQQDPLRKASVSVARAKQSGGAEKATDPASSDVIASPAPLSSRPFLDLHSCQEAQPRHLHGDTRHCMPGGSASAFPGLLSSWWSFGSLELPLATLRRAQDSCTLQRIFAYTNCAHAPAHISYLCRT